YHRPRTGLGIHRVIDFYVVEFMTADLLGSTPATRTAKRSRKTMVASLSTPYATSARAKNCLTIINSKWTNRSRARSKLRMHAIVAAQIAAAPCLIQVVNADLLGKDNR